MVRNCQFCWWNEYPVARGWHCLVTQFQDPASIGGRSPSADETEMARGCGGAGVGDPNTRFELIHFSILRNLFWVPADVSVYSLPPWGYLVPLFLDALSTLHLSHSSAHSETWGRDRYYYCHFADKETGAQCRCGTWVEPGWEHSSDPSLQDTLCSFLFTFSPKPKQQEKKKASEGK